VTSFRDTDPSSLFAWGLCRLYRHLYQAVPLYLTVLGYK
jgi:hypothetical protein